MTTPITRRAALAAGAGLGAATLLRRPARAATFSPPGSLVDAAKKEGRLVYYTANLAEPEQEMIEQFNKQFPSISVQMVRASGGQLITRVKTEAAAGKLVADVVDHSDRGLMKGIEDLFADYAPPNAADYLPEALVSPKLWPRITAGWVIAYNSELLKNPPKSWMDLCKPDYGGGKIGQVIGPSGGTTWTRVMFERQVVDPDYWKKQAATKPVLYLSNGPASDSLVRGEVQIAPLIYNAAYPKKRDGAPVAVVFGAEGVPIVPFAAGIPKTAANPNAARLFLDWNMSVDGQTYSIRDVGNLTSLKTPPYNPEGFDPKVQKVWLPKFQEFADLHDKWLEEWNVTYGYRQ